MKSHITAGAFACCAVLASGLISVLASADVSSPVAQTQAPAIYKSDKLGVISTPLFNPDKAALGDIAARLGEAAERNAAVLAKLKKRAEEQKPVTFDQRFGGFAGTYRPHPVKTISIRPLSPYDGPYLDLAHSKVI